MTVNDTSISQLSKDVSSIWIRNLKQYVCRDEQDQLRVTQGAESGV